MEIHQRKNDVSLQNDVFLRARQGFARRDADLELDQIGRPDASEVDYDFLATLVADLAARGTRYEIVRVQQESDVEAPAFTGVPPAITGPQDVRLTMRDVANAVIESATAGS